MSIPYHRPASLEKALVIRAREDVVVLAGATDVYPAKASRAGWGDMHHKAVLDISRIPNLRGIAEEADHWRIGALTTWTDLIRAELLPMFDGLKRAAREVGGVQIQNRGTIAGNICTASPAGDGAPNLLVLDARVELASTAARRIVPMHEFIDGYRHTQCRPDEIVTAVLVPKPRHSARGHFLKLGARKYLVISIVMVAGVIEIDAAGVVAAARLAIGSCSVAPQRLPALEAEIAGLPIRQASSRVQAAHVAHLAPIDDIRASAAYRLEAAVQLTRDLLADLAGDAVRSAA